MGLKLNISEKQYNVAELQEKILANIATELREKLEKKEPRMSAEDNSKARAEMAAVNKHAVDILGALILQTNGDGMMSERSLKQAIRNGNDRYDGFERSRTRDAAFMTAFSMVLQGLRLHEALAGTVQSEPKENAAGIFAKSKPYIKPTNIKTADGTPLPAVPSDALSYSSITETSVYRKKINAIWPTLKEAALSAPGHWVDFTTDGMALQGGIFREPQSNSNVFYISGESWRTALEPVLKAIAADRQRIMEARTSPRKLVVPKEKKERLISFSAAAENRTKESWACSFREKIKAAYEAASLETGTLKDIEVNGYPLRVKLSVRGSDSEIIWTTHDSLADFQKALNTEKLKARAESNSVISDILQHGLGSRRGAFGR